MSEEIKLNRKETILELRELIHDYPGFIPSAARRGLKNALAQLEPDPKLLTADELRDLPRTTIVWIDYWDGEENKLGALLAGIKCYDGSIVDEDGSIYIHFEKEMMPTGDGSHWTFWSGKPATEQRLAVMQK